MVSAERREPYLLPDPFEVRRKVPELKKIIVQASKRLDGEGYTDKRGIRRIEMVIDKGELSWFHHLDESGPSKVWVGMAYVDDQLIYNFQRINEEEETIGGTMAVHLPVRPEIINIGTLPTYDRHLNTVADWQEEERWVREGQVVKPGYMIECYRRAMEKLLGIKAQKAS